MLLSHGASLHLMGHHPILRGITSSYGHCSGVTVSLCIIPWYLRTPGSPSPHQPGYSPHQYLRVSHVAAGSLVPPSAP